MKISELKQFFNLEFDRDFEFDTMGWVGSTTPNTLSYAAQMKYLNELLANKNITAVITTKELADKAGGLGVIVSDDPTATFYQIFDIWSGLSKQPQKTFISPNAVIHPSAIICEHDVYIDDGVVIEENVVIKSDVSIGKNSIIRSNCVIGNEGFEVKKIAGQNISIKHNGVVKIGENVEIQASCCVDKGLMGRDTIIGDFTKLDNLCHIAHCVQIGKNCALTAKAMIAGSVSLGDNVWVGPGSNISSGVTVKDNVRITIGSTVVKDVPENKVVTGYFAQEHAVFLKKYLRIFRS